MSFEHIKLETKGVITLNDKLVISDPCYDLETWCQGILENMLPGVYICRYRYDENEDRVSDISIHHSSLSSDQLDDAIIDSIQTDFEVGVDSGMAGFFDYDYYVEHHKPDHDENNSNDDWYDNIYYSAITPVPNTKFCKYLNDEWFSQHIDEMLDSLKTYMLPEDGLRLYLHLCNYADTILFHGAPLSDSIHRNTYVKLIDEKLKNAGFTQNIKTLLPGDDAADARENKAKSDIQLWLYRIDKKIPVEQRYTTINRYTASITDNKAFVSFSGFGDGGYNCYYHKNKNDKIDYVEIVYYDPEETDENE